MAAPSSAVNEVNIAVLMTQVLALQEHQDIQDSLILEMRKERDQALKWGLITLGIGRRSHLRTLSACRRD